MRALRSVFFVLFLVMTAGCESGGLGMNVTVEEIDVPSRIPDTVAEKMTGSLTIAVTDDRAKGFLDAFTKEFGSEDTPDGTLIFTELSVRNRATNQPPRASGEIDATCIWKETDGKAECYKVKIRTFSIEIDDRKTQHQWLKDEAFKRMVAELADEM